LDVCCGCGGNTIAFAQIPNTLVIAVDSNVERLCYAANNCAIYNIPTDSVIFIHGDAFEVLKHYVVDEDDIKGQPNTNQESPILKIHMGYRIGGLDLLPPSIDVVFSSPPWGLGPEYVLKETFSLQDIKMISHLHSSNCQDTQTHSWTAIDLLNLSLKASRSKIVIMFLPRNLHGEQLGHEAMSIGYLGPLELEQQILNGKLKTLTAYFSGAR
jgi:trimethylguanosine synthase